MYRPAVLIILTFRQPLRTRAARARRRTGGSTTLGQISALVCDSFACILIAMYICTLIYSWWSERVEAASSASSSEPHKGDGDRSEGSQSKSKGSTSVKMSGGGGGGERAKQEDW